MILWSESCDFVGSSQTQKEAVWTASVNSGAHVTGWGTTGGRFGGGRFTTNDLGASLTQQFGLTSEVYISLWMQFQTEFRLQLQYFGTNQVMLRVPSAGGQIEIRRGDQTGTLIADSGGFGLSENTWHHIEFRLLIDDTVGEAEVRVDKVVRVNGTGLDTDPAGSNSVTTIEFRSNDIATLDDIVVQDAAGAFLGLHRLRSGLVDADGAVTNFAPLGMGTNFSEVDDATLDEDTSYNESSTPSDRDQLGIPNLGFAGQAVAVIVKAAQMLVDPGTTKLKLGFLSGVSEDLSAAMDPTLAAYYNLIYASVADPATSDPWTAATLAAAEAIYEIG